MVEIIAVLCDVRSLYNVGSVIRTAEGLGLRKVYTVGSAPHMRQAEDSRLPHVIKRAEDRIAKTALGAERLIENRHFSSFDKLMKQLKHDGFAVAALERTEHSKDLFTYQPAGKVALLLGPETAGLNKQQLEAADIRLEIPMRGTKESFNVSVAAGIALSYLINYDQKHGSLST